MSSLVLSFLNESLSFLQVTRTIIKACMSLNFCQIPPPTIELAALECLINECIVVNTLAPLFLIRSYSFLHVTRTALTAWMSLKFSKIEHGSMELAAFEHLKKSPYTYNRSNVVSTPVLSFLDGSSSLFRY